MYMARQLMLASGGRALTIAKIERVEAVAALEEILDASDGLDVYKRQAQHHIYNLQLVRTLKLN